MKPELFATAVRLTDLALRDWMETPRSVDVNGHQFAIVTNGHALLAIPGMAAVPADTEPHVPHSAIAHMAGMLFDAYPHTSVVSLADVVDWIGSPRPCEECGGTGKVPCDGCKGTGTTEHECSCEYCQWRGLEECFACDGEKTIGCVCLAEEEQCIFFGQPFDKRVLRYAVPRTGESVAVDWSEDWSNPVRVRGDGWTLIVMGIRQAKDDAPEFPVAADRAFSDHEREPGRNEVEP